MSNRAALYVFIVIAAVLILVLATVDGAGVFLARRFLDLIRWLAFWR